jgi:putative flippase GtrA
MRSREKQVRYVINGAFATGVHYLALSAGINVIGIASASVANFFAATIGIATSFVGSKYFVFRGSHGLFHEQAAKFVTLYGLIALMHGLVLGLITDIGGLDYRIGFILATGLQVALSYSGNQRFVFK